MTSDQRLAGVRLKTERARQHIRDLENGWSAFSNSGPYSVGVRYDATTTRNTYYLTSAADVPADLALIAGDAIQNLRSALDHLAYQLVLVGKGSAGPFRHVYFPIADDAAKYENVKASQTAGMRPEAVAAIDAVKPYRSGNDTLWRLHALNLIDKHRLLVTLLARSAVGIGAVMTRELAALAPAFSDLKMPELYLNDAKLEPLKTGDDLYIDKPGAPPMPGLKFRFQLAIAEPAVVDGAALIPMLQEMATTAEKLTQDFAPLLRQFGGRAIIDSVLLSYTPMSAMLVHAPFHRPGRVYEEKVDGWRMLAYKEGRSVRLVSRNGVDHARRFRDLAAAVAKLAARTLVLDAQVAIYDDHLRSRFDLLRDPDPNAVATPPLLMAFDLMYLNGRDLGQRPLGLFLSRGSRAHARQRHGQGHAVAYELRS